MNRAIWANLLWKEWHEHRWKLAALTAILLGGFASIWATDFREDALPFAWFILMLYTPLATLFIGVGLTAGERAQGTLGCLQKLPVSVRSVALVKLVVGYATCVLPGILLFGLCWLIVASGWNPRLLSTDIPPGILGSGLWWLEIGLVFLLSSASLLVWVVSLGVKQTTELRAGALALLVIVGLWLLGGASMMALQRLLLVPEESVELYNQISLMMVSLVGVLPGGVFLLGLTPQGFFPPTTRLMAWCLFIGVHAALIWWWTIRYGSQATRVHSAVEFPEPTTEKFSWLGAPRHTPFRSILWKQVRECLPIIGGVLALAFGYRAFLMTVAGDGFDLSTRVQAVIWTTAMSGFLAAILVGVACFQDDLNSGLSGFWRSRPIDPDQWFWIKYASGLAVLATVFGGVYAIAWLLDPSESTQSSEHLLQVVFSFWTVYASAVCVACLVRNVIYAGILSFAVAAYTTWLALVPYNGEQLPVALQAVILTSVSVGLTLLAWQAMRRDWALRLA